MAALHRATFTTLIATLTLGAIWLLTHPYFGVRHDGWLYAGHALARLYPTAFHQDLYFAHGSPDDFSIFGPIYSSVVNVLGIGRGALWMLICAQVAWIGAAFLLVRNWLTGTALWITLALMFGLPREYGLEGTLGYAENFLTARSFAEPLVLLAIAASLAGWRRSAWASGLLATAIHPVMALPGLIFLAAQTWSLRKPTLLGIALALVLIIGLMPAIDPEWLGIIRIGAPLVLLEHWPPDQLVGPLAWVSVLAMATFDPRSVLQGPARALLYAVATCALLAALGVLTHAEKLVQAQPWRVVWLLQVVSVPMLVVLFVERWPRSEADRWLLAALVAAILVGGMVGAMLALALAIVGHRAWNNGEPPTLRPVFIRGIAIGIAAVMLPTVLLTLQAGLAAASGVLDWLALPHDAPFGSLSGLLTGPLALLLPIVLWGLLALSRRAPLTAMMIASVGLLGGAARWNQADPAQTITLFHENESRPFDGLIPSGATVYWQEHFEYAWFLLHRANYGSTLQAAGVAFSRESAIESRRRLTRLTHFGSYDGRMGAHSRWTITPRPPSPASVRELCADRALDFLILAIRLPMTKPPSAQVAGTEWFLYACSGFRQTSPSLLEIADPPATRAIRPES